MADVKKYLDYAGLSHYDVKIKEWFKSHGSDVTDALIELIGASELGADESTILERIEALEGAVGDVSELGEEVENLVKAILGEAARAQEAESALSDRFGDLGQDEDGSDVTVKDYVDSKVSDAEDAVDSLREELYGNGKAEDEDGYVQGDIPTLQADVADIQGRLDVIEGEGEGSIKKAAEDATTSAIAQLISDSEDDPINERFDTLKEIADWIVAETGNAEGLDAAQRLQNLETLVGSEAKEAEGEEGEEGYKPATPASGLVKDVEDLQEVVDAFTPITDTEIDALFPTTTPEEPVEP